jgi:hypothetical protein
MGRLFAEIRPAPYALPRGVPALQQDPSLTRRAFAAAGLSGFALALGGGWAWRKLFGGAAGDASPAVEAGAPIDAPPTSVADLQLAWARALAQGPLPELIRSHGPLLARLERHPRDPVLWRGAERLVAAALVEDGVDAEAFVRRVCTTLGRTAAPPQIEAQAPKLRARLAELAGRR